MCGFGVGTHPLPVATTFTTETPNASPISLCLLQVLLVAHILLQLGISTSKKKTKKYI